ncbi:zinc finger protein 853 isoform X2 [Eurytemora carolleeae]|uniref:zinc finger protein 853 isoform X2 n=1 Tax=Eurytemora carolleeae TaxID=1294199 RepID=UPI000C75CED6|nr:zinc finger protein 853 isoform X2 [Eurytemora carolleeae]|eukprot:XP_023337644.1 zinc finger protein 853-like isoform X2 [Eurytemora affinis]
MDRDRVASRDRVQGSLLNKAYEMQCMRDREFNMMDSLSRMDLQGVSISTDNNLFTSAPLRVQGGRMVGGGGGYKINGQQLQLQLDQLAGAMTDMMMDDDEMEAPVNQAYTQYIQERTEVENPFSQDTKRSDPVYLSSMAAHTAVPNSNSQQLLEQQIQQQQLQQQHEEQQKYFLAFLQQQQITAEQFTQQEQYYQQLLEQQYAHQQQLIIEQQLTVELQEKAKPLTAGCCMPAAVGRSGILKRPDLIPMQKCYMWT